MTTVSSYETSIFVCRLCKKSCLRKCIAGSKKKTIQKLAFPCVVYLQKYHDVLCTSPTKPPAQIQVSLHTSPLSSPHRVLRSHKRKPWYNEHFPLAALTKALHCCKTGHRMELLVAKKKFTSNKILQSLAINMAQR